MSRAALVTDVFRYQCVLLLEHGFPGVARIHECFLMLVFWAGVYLISARATACARVKRVACSANLPYLDTQAITIIDLP